MHHLLLIPIQSLLTYIFETILHEINLPPATAYLLTTTTTVLRHFIRIATRVNTHTGIYLTVAVYSFTLEPDAAGSSMLSCCLGAVHHRKANVYLNNSLHSSSATSRNPDAINSPLLAQVRNAASIIALSRRFLEKPRNGSSIRGSRRADALPLLVQSNLFLGRRSKFVPSIQHAPRPHLIFLSSTNATSAS